MLRLLFLSVLFVCLEMSLNDLLKCLSVVLMMCVSV